MSILLLSDMFYEKWKEILLMWEHGRILDDYEKLPLRPQFMCHNPNLGLTTKARAYKGAGQEGSPRVTSHAPGNVRECEGMNPHTPK
jgi:hypothetical protein